MSKDKVEISKIEIKIGGEKHALTMEQAKELKDILNELFGAPEHHYHTHINPWSRRYYWQPYWYDQIYCGTNKQTPSWQVSSSNSTLCLAAS